MTTEAWITIGIIIISAILLITERVRSDLVAIFVALSLRLTGVLSTEQALSGFSQSAVLTILSVFIITHGLEKTGATGSEGTLLVDDILLYKSAL